jgi:SAM-dependent methyltransferase
MPTAENHADTRRAIRLFRAFLHEQANPDHFYSILANDSAKQMSQYVELNGATVLDVGGGPGYFAEAFRAAGAAYVGLEPDAGEMSARGSAASGMARASGEALPVRSGSVDVCYSSNVLEHVASPWRMAAEMVRVTRPGGTVFLSFTPWWSPWGGHETAPWHYLGGQHARRRYTRRTGHEPKNRFGESLFAVTVAEAIRWARNCPDVRIVAAIPRYHPRWATWVVRIPGLREVVSWNLALVLERRPTSYVHHIDKGDTRP